jgi:hypothetical protein
MKYQLLQIKKWEDCNYFFRDWKCAQKNYFSLDDYKVVYEGEINGTDVDEVLENLFTIFNIKQPKDFRGHSMSVSDVVCLDGTYYYTDNVGFVKIN